jgi:nucleoside-diphosphate-sugar epimerase
VDVYTKSGQSYPIREDAERKPLPSFPYALNKARCEEALFAAHQRGDLNVTAIRPAHTYGEGGRLLHTMGFGTYIVSRIRRELPIIVHGDGRSLWSACHRDDVARAFVGALGNSRAYGKAYHVTAEEWLTWDRYYQGVAQAMGVDELNLVHIPTSLLGKVAPEEAQWCVENFSHNNIFDNTAARRDLGFAYTIPWVQGIGRAIGWMEANGQVEDADDYPFYDRIITAWRRLRKTMINELGDLQG